MMMQDNNQMRTTFFSNPLGWGDVLFPGFHTNNYGQFFGLLILSFVVGYSKIYYSKLNDPTNRSIYFLFYSGKGALQFIAMNLAMTMNVWIFLCICFGQGFGYFYTKKIEFIGEPENCKCETENCECEPENCEC